jgi:diadenosine tetraphosphatase ApaH/serine/threonine PP2A family protein phosphatase
MKRPEDNGPFDIVGDVHGCSVELEELLARLEYRPSNAGAALVHPAGRRVIFLGDLVDRGPDAPGVLRRAMAMVAAGQALCVPGNHDDKLLRKLRGRNVRIAHGLPVRVNWALRYRGRAAVVYGHTPVAEPRWLHNTINIDTGCVFGGRLTALRYPERELVSVPARAVYAVPGRPFLREHQRAAS